MYTYIYTHIHTHTYIYTHAHILYISRLTKTSECECASASRRAEAFLRRARSILSAANSVPLLAALMASRKTRVAEPNHLVPFRSHGISPTRTCFRDAS